MAGMVLTFTIDGETALLRKLEGVSAEMKDWTPEFRKTGSMLQKTFRDNFAQEGAMLGKAWAPLAASTLRQKQRQGYPSDTLVRTGKMMNSFRSSASATFVEIENPVPYFVYHQSKAPRVRLPRRVMMHLDEKRKQLIVKIFQAAIGDKLRKRGFN